MNYFLVSKQGLTGREEKKRKIERDQVNVWIHDFCMDIWSLVWNLSMD